MDSHTTTTRNTSETQIHIRKVALFLALAFGIAWFSAIALYLAEIELGTLVGLVTVVVMFMWAPVIAAIGTQRWYGESIRKGCGIKVGQLRWVGLARITPVVFVGATIGIGLTIPGVTFTTDYAAYLLEVGMTAEQAAEAVAQLEAVPVPPSVLFVAQGLIAGVTINALAALGEELGWRGLLLSELAPLGFRKLSILTGAIWGIWHAPIILQGHNFPEAPIAGVFMMTIAMIAITPIYTYLTVRARSVLAATFLHGSFNGLGAIALVYLTGAGNLLISPVGVAWIGAALLITSLCVVHDKFIAEEPITTGQPLSPWGQT